VFAERIALPASVVLPLPESLSLAIGAYVEPVAATLAVLRAPIARGERGLVLGEGRIAELTRRVLVACGFERIELVATAALVPKSTFDFAIETRATDEAFDALISAIVPGGRIVLKSRPAAKVSLDVSRAVAREVSLHAVRYGSFREAIALLASGRLAIDDLLERPASLGDYERVFAEARGSEAKKALFEIGMG
jgi:L-iditol 2-dehydrogenase